MKWLKRFCLEMWSKIKHPFGRRKMGIEETINAWFDATQREIMVVSNTDKTFTTSFCCVAIAVMKLYCRATGHLIDNNFRLPAMALLRVISEFFIKFLWCTMMDNKILADAEVKQRIARWEKTSGQKQIKLIDDFLKLNNVFSDEQLQKLKGTRDSTDANISSNTQPGMPNVTGNGSLFEDVAAIFGANVSGFLYGQYSSAIHIPTSILTGFIVSNNQGLFIRDDAEESTEQLGKICLNFAYMFLKAIYNWYGWDIVSIQSEYEKITGSKG